MGVRVKLKCYNEELRLVLAHLNKEVLPVYLPKVLPDHSSVVWCRVIPHRNGLLHPHETRELKFLGLCFELLVVSIEADAR